MAKIETDRTIEQVPVADLVPYARNARTHSDAQIEQIAGSIREFGFTNPCLIDEQSTLIAGHGRVMAARKLKLNSLPCIRLVGLSEAQKRALVIADNQIATNAGWNEELLSSELAALAEDNYDLALLGFDDSELDRLLHDEIPIVEGEADQDDAPELGDQAFTKLGDFWQLGEHRLICGDARRVDVLEQLLQGQAADLLLTDPPYGVDYQGTQGDQKRTKRRKIQNDQLTDDELVEFLKESFAAALAVLKGAAPWYVWHAATTQTEFAIALAGVGKKFSAQIIWRKAEFTGGWGDYRWQHENCYYCSAGKNAWHGGRDQSTIWEFGRDGGYRHPTQKPVELMARAIRNSSKLGDVVLDLFGGSGSTLIAAHKLGRVARLVELDPVYCDVILARYAGFTDEQPVLCGSGQTWAEIRAAATV